jgi:hypothetical protein
MIGSDGMLEAELTIRLLHDIGDVVMATCMLFIFYDVWRIRRLLEEEEDD